MMRSPCQLQKGLATERETAELREQFIAVLGHDLRNPLTAIGAGARILQRSGALQENKHLRVLDMINTTVTRMSEPLEPILEQVVDRLRTSSPDRTIETSFGITVPVDCDRARVGSSCPISSATRSPMEHPIGPFASERN